jgi:hypothetical protein
MTQPDQPRLAFLKGLLKAMPPKGRFLKAMSLEKKLPKKTLPRSRESNE